MLHLSFNAEGLAAVVQRDDMRHERKRRAMRHSVALLDRSGRTARTLTLISATPDQARRLAENILSKRPRDYAGLRVGIASLA
jgi:hypothetical protein